MSLKSIFLRSQSPRYPGSFSPQSPLCCRGLQCACVRNVFFVAVLRALSSKSMHLTSMNVTLTLSSWVKLPQFIHLSNGACLIGKLWEWNKTLKWKHPAQCYIYGGCSVNLGCIGIWVTLGRIHYWDDWPLHLNSKWDMYFPFCQEALIWQNQNNHQLNTY